MKRLTALLIALLAMTVLFTACSGDSPSTTDTTAAPTTTAAPETEPPVTDLEIVKDGVANYRVIRAEEATQSTIDAATLVRSQIGKETGAFPDISTDWVKRGTELDHESLEILVGATAYEESAKALEGVPYGDYIVTCVGNKIVINAWSDAGLDAAVTALGRELISNADTGSFTLPADFKLTGTKIEIVNQLPTYAGGSLRSIYHSGDDNQVVIIDDTTPDEYAAYRKTLESAGYTLYTENDITDNKFATYVNDKYVVNAGYYAYETAARIIIEPRTTLPALASENKYESKVQPSFAMLGLEFTSGDSLTENGLCFIYQLADGSYIIIDGGFNRARDAKALYDYMREHAPDKDNITIAAWFITHSHGDHNGAWYKFSETYASKVNLELLVGNFPSDEARLDGGLGTEGGGGPKTMNYVYNYKGAEFIKAHTGYQFHLRDAEVEILYTLESYAPSVLNYLNTSSLIFTIKIAGQQFLILGDASNYGCDIAQKMYGDYLKSDIIQTAHHGYGTGTSSYGGVTAVYTKAAAPVVFWPVGAKDYANMHTRAYDAHLQNLATTKEIIVAGSREVRVMLPYTMGTSGYETILK
ncbi:MAG: MBL fold metallo-hydrolase [Clostridia bacterium]|nr:MBL fold metallo-hydrolase [Clostridia bacterium]